MSDFSRPTFDDTFGYYNDRWAEPTKGPMLGRVVPGSQNHKKHRVDVYIPHFNVVLHDVRVTVPWSAGEGTGIHALPHDSAEVHVQLKGKSAGIGQAEVTGVVYSEGQYPAPAHPSLENLKNYYAVQGRLNTGNSFIPGTINILDEQGGQHNLVMGKETYHSQGMTDMRYKGLSMTEAEHHSMFSSNILSQASAAAAKLDTSDLKALGQDLSKLSNALGQSRVATSSAALAHAQEVISQAEAVYIAKFANRIAEGQQPENV